MGTGEEPKLISMGAYIKSKEEKKKAEIEKQAHEFERGAIVRGIEPVKLRKRLREKYIGARLSKSFLSPAEGDDKIDIYIKDTIRPGFDEYWAKMRARAKQSETSRLYRYLLDKLPNQKDEITELYLAGRLYGCPNEPNQIKKYTEWYLAGRKQDFISRMAEGKKKAKERRENEVEKKCTTERFDAMLQAGVPLDVIVKMKGNKEEE